MIARWDTYRISEDHRLLRAELLPLPGDRPRPGPDLDERQRGRQRKVPRGGPAVFFDCRNETHGADVLSDRHRTSDGWTANGERSTIGNAQRGE